MRALLVPLLGLLMMPASVEAKGDACALLDVKGACIYAEDVEPIHKIRRDTPYALARSKIMAAGYRPIEVPGRPEDRCEPGRTECAVYPETMHCEGSGRAALCQFAFQKGRAYYMVQTSGETAKIDGAAFMSNEEHAKLMSKTQAVR